MKKTTVANLALALCLAFPLAARAEVKPQLDFYAGSHNAATLRAGGALGVPIGNLAPLLSTSQIFPVYLRGSLSLEDTTSRFTLGPDFMSPWILFFRGQFGGGVEAVRKTGAVTTTTLQPYLRLGTQVWICFTDVDLTREGTRYSGGFRFEF